MEKIIALFGPPGVGKSTLVKLAQAKNLNAIDLEEVADNLEERKKYLKKLMNSNEFLLIGSADLGPKDFPSSAKTILLLPPEEIFLDRNKQRDQLLPHKRNQQALKFYHLSNLWRKHFDLVIEEVGTPEEILGIILKP